jgi:polygalacturonase
MNRFLPFTLFLLLLAASFCLQAQSYDIRNYGATANSPKTSTAAIQRAIDDCAHHGGGRVYVPAGVFVVGTFHLASNIDLYLESGAVLKGSPRLADYESYSKEGYGVNHYGILYTPNAENVSISGMGTIDGNDSAFFDFQQAKVIDSVGTRFTRQGSNYRHVASGIGDGPVVPKERPRQMVIFSNCRHVQLTNVNLLHSPFWTLHFADCDDVNVSGIRLWSGMLIPNGDGIDINSCSNVVINACDIRAGDDAIAITGFNHHFEIPGFNGSRHPSGNIIVSNCNLQSASSGIRIGFLDQNTVRNVHVSHVNITNSTRGIGIFLRDEGSLENLFFEDITIETRLRTGDWWGNGEPIHISAVRGKEDVKLGSIRNVSFRNIQCRAENGILLFGSKESHLEQLTLENITLQLINSPLNAVAGGNIDLRGCLDPREQLFSSEIPAVDAQWVDGLSIKGVHVNWDSAMIQPYFTNALRMAQCPDPSIEGFAGMPAPGNKQLPAVNTLP